MYHSPIPFLALVPLVLCNQPEFGDLLEAQFLNISDEISLYKRTNTLEVPLNTVHQEQASWKDWYKIQISLDTPRIEKQWIDVHNSSEIKPNQFEHGYYVKKM